MSTTQGSNDHRNSSQIDFSVVEGAKIVYEAYGPQGPSTDNVTSTSVILDHAAGKALLYASVVQTPPSPPKWWKKDCDTLNVVIELHEITQVATHPAHPKDAVILRRLPDGSVELSLTQKDQEVRVRSRGCSLREYGMMIYSDAP